MKKRKILRWFLAVVLIGGLLYAFLSFIMKQKSENIIGLTKEEKIEDLEYLQDTLDNSYPFFIDFKESEINKEKIYKDYTDNISKTPTDIAFMKEIYFFLGEFKGYGHLSLLDGYTYDMYKNVFLLANEDEKEMMKLWEDTLKNEKSQRFYSMLDKTPGKIRSIKFLKKKYIKPQNKGNDEDDETVKNLEFEMMDERNAVYVKINAFHYEYIENDRIKLQRLYDQIGDAQHLILDIRGNIGGSDNYWEQLIVEPNVKKQITNKRYALFDKNNTTAPFLDFLETRFNESEIRPINDLPKFLERDSSTLSNWSNYVEVTNVYDQPDQPKFKGKIWVLTDNKIYSASENFVMLCKNTGFATLVGQPTGGDGGLMDPILITLPNSGLIVRFSMLYGLNNDGTGNEAYGTKPDLLVKETDDALKICLEAIDSGF